MTAVERAASFLLDRGLPFSYNSELMKRHFHNFNENSANVALRIPYKRYTLCATIIYLYIITEI